MIWIPVEERLPEAVDTGWSKVSKPVLCVSSGREIIIATLDDAGPDGGIQWEDNHGYRRIVTHWMPLPEAPCKP